jgi:hypothetical protein
MRAIGLAVIGLRGAGYSWTETAARLGVTRQAAQQRWATVSLGVRSRIKNGITTSVTGVPLRHAAFRLAVAPFGNRPLSRLRGQSGIGDEFIRCRLCASR